jgi:hypothetical protein
MVLTAEKSRRICGIYRPLQIGFIHVGPCLSVIDFDQGFDVNGDFPKTFFKVNVHHRIELVAKAS